jgi:predicted secreted protein
MEVDSRVDRRWLAASTQFIRSLPGHDILTVYAYTTPQGFDYVLDMLRGGTKYEELVLPRASDLCPSAARHAALRVWKSDARRGSLDARIKRHLAAEQMIDRSTEETAETGYEAWDRATDELVALRAADASFRRRVYASFVRHEWSLACVFTHAARRVTTQFKRDFPNLTADAWRAILEQFVGDLDSVFARAPPVPAPFTVFRGTKRAGAHADVSTSITVVRGAQGNWYVSTSMCREVAMHFTDKRDPIVEEITVPRGARLIALCAVSRYPKEAELLLPRHFAS